MTANSVIEVPWNLTVPEADIYLVGHGLRLPNDLTLEALAVIKRCKRVFGVPPLHAPEFGLPEMENLCEYYGTDKKRTRTYQEWFDLVLDAAATDAPVALVTGGSVMVGALTPHRILAEAPLRGLSVHVTNAVSCFDGIWADLNIEPFYGFSVWEATAFVKLGIAPDTSSVLMLPQAPLFEISTGPDISTNTIEASSTITKVRDQLLKFYPPDHEVHFVHTGTGTGTHALRARIETVRLGELDHPGGHVLSTLVVPRLVHSERLNFNRPAVRQTAEAVS